MTARESSAQNGNAVPMSAKAVLRYRFLAGPLP